MVPTVIYDQLKFWLPLASAFILAYKGFQSIKKSIDGWAEKLFSNHLFHIQEATTNTVTETKATNELLKASALRDLDIARHVTEVKESLQANEKMTRGHEDKEMMVWQGVVNTLTVLEDRSRIKTPRRARRR